MKTFEQIREEQQQLEEIKLKDLKAEILKQGNALRPHLVKAAKVASKAGGTAYDYTIGDKLPLKKTRRLIAALALASILPTSWFAVTEFGPKVEWVISAAEYINIPVSAIIMAFKKFGYSAVSLAALIVATNSKRTGEAIIDEWFATKQYWTKNKGVLKSFSTDQKMSISDLKKFQKLAKKYK